ncbi:cox-type terminal oxidase subunit III [Haladaptatus sp. R4]|uniref:cytochrome c oxidase subunit 3 n=1 Tax=Haladaptatus sp. R4 TaxID=1679489 RepID=UPI0007B48D04|nr:heme-copper oxidase subunit III [Haladaptatus sp. R4]KZN24066.1 cox-type terminal oxidase subunit III [Haladaptatus sp. R4]
MSESVAHGESSGTDGSAHHEGSRWPIIGAIGAGTMYLGAALTILGHVTDVFPELAGWVIAIGGLAVLVVGLGGWLNQAYVHDYWQGRVSKTKYTYEATMVTFLLTDIATFGAVFTYYFFIRVQPWPPTELPDVLSSLLLVNTAVLVLSSFTLHFSHIALGKGKRKRFLTLLGVTVVLGAGFVAGQAYEYYDFISHEGFTLTSGLFGSAFFGLTGLHGLHVTLGVILLCVVFARAIRGQYAPDRDASVSTVSMYWHFVDAIWLLLVVVLYFGSSISG